MRGGRFVSGFSGEQYALPAGRTSSSPRPGATAAHRRAGHVNATDPLNLVGVIVPGARVPAVRTRRVTFVDGVFEDIRSDPADEGDDAGPADEMVTAEGAQRLSVRGSHA